MIYVEPGPSDSLIDEHARHVLEDQSVSGAGGGLGYVVLDEADFDRLWVGVDEGDALWMASAVLDLLGPESEEFINLERDFIYGWVGCDDEHHGRVLLLQVIPRPPMRAVGDAANN